MTGAPSTPTTPASWRHRIKVHPAADSFPMLSDTELDELARDIDKNGLRIPLSFWKVDEHASAELIDGRNRVAAMARLADGLDRIEGAIGLANFYTGDRVDPWAFVISANIRRRHLSPEQKRELISSVLRADPSRSDRSIAKLADSNRTTVGQVRADLEAAGKVSIVDTRTDARGHQQPAHKPPPSKEAQLRAMRERSALPPIVPEIQRPGPAAAPAETDAASSISQPDAQMIAETRRRIGLAVPPLLARDPVGGLDHIAKVIERSAVAKAMSHAKRISAAFAFLAALSVKPADLGE